MVSGAKVLGTAQPSRPLLCLTGVQHFANSGAPASEFAVREGKVARRLVALCFPLMFALDLFSGSLAAQTRPGGPPAVGVVRAERQQITQSDEFIGRIQAVNRVV